LIRRVPLFAMLTDAQATAVSDAIVKRRYKRGDRIVEQGKKSNALFIMLTGRARVISGDARGREVILAILQPGDYIGEMSLIDNEPHSATVQAEIQTDVLELATGRFCALPSREHLHGLCRDERAGAAPAPCRQARSQSLALMDVYGRVARALLETATPDAHGTDDDPRPRFRALISPRWSAPRGRW
jgi:CRP/FNR family cyclic AMP-dependent transcriptional regulator